MWLLMPFCDTHWHLKTFTGTGGLLISTYSKLRSSAGTTRREVPGTQSREASEAQRATHSPARALMGAKPASEASSERRRSFESLLRYSERGTPQ